MALAAVTAPSVAPFLRSSPSRECTATTPLGFARYCVTSSAVRGFATSAESRRSSGSGAAGKSRSHASSSRNCSGGSAGLLDSQKLSQSSSSSVEPGRNVTYTWFEASTVPVHFPRL